MSDGASCQGGNYLTAFAVGALVGAGVALLFAPHSGRETRNMLAAQTKDLKEKAEGVIGDAKEMIQHNKSKIMAAVEAGKEAMRDEASK